MAKPRVRFAPSPTGPLHAGSARTALLNWLFARSTQGTVLLRIDDTDRERSSAEWEQEIFTGLTALGLDWDEGPLRQSERGDNYRAALRRLSLDRVDDAYVFEGRVVARADGSALYHLATAVDDIEDRITHVLRGRDHQSNTELQSRLIMALGARPPQYVHAPLLVGEDRAKLSKRAGGGVTVAALLAEGFPASALLNSLALSLADFGTDEIMGRDEMVERFDLQRLHTADSRWDEDKLRWISGQHIRAMSPGRFAESVAPLLDEDPPRGARGLAALTGAQGDGATLRECAASVAVLLRGAAPDTQAAVALMADDSERAIAIFCDQLNVLVGDDDPSLETAREIVSGYREALKNAGIKLPIGLKALRARLTGAVHGPELPYVVGAAGAQRLRKLCRP